MKITKVVIGCFIACMALVTGIAHNHLFANTGRDISNNAVRSLSVNSSNILDGDKIRVDMDFDDQNGKIQSGDIIRINWQSSGQAYFLGYTKKFPLTVQGHHVGEANISTTGATLTFNDTVNNLHNVSGSLYFEMQGRNITSTLNEDVKSAVINAGTLHLPINITKPASGTQGVFYYKTGDMLVDDTDHVRWFLNIKNNQSYVQKDIYIIDNIQDGQRLDDHSFSITVTGQKPGHFSGDNAIKEFENAFPGSQIIYRTNDNEITVYIPQNVASLNNFSIMYKTKITDYSKKEFVNKTKAWFKEYGQEEVSGEEFNFTVANIHAGANITGTVQGELKIFKVVEGTKNPIEGVSFLVEKVDGSIIKDGKTSLEITTNADGIADVKNLSVGKYIVKEVSAPSWIAFDPLSAPMLEFEVKITDTQGFMFEVSNSLKTMSIPVEKKWIGSKQEQVFIHLYANEKEIETIVLNEQNQWKSVFTNLPVYDVDTGKEISYTIKEDVIDGYHSTITGSMNEGFVVTNKQMKESEKEDDNHQDIEKEDGNLNEDIQENIKEDGNLNEDIQEDIQKDNHSDIKEENVKVEIKGESKEEENTQLEDKKHVVGEAEDKIEDRKSVNTSDVQLTTLWISAVVVSFLIIVVLSYKYKINKT